MNRYLQNSSSYFTTGSTFLFLPGNHSLNISLNLAAVSNISFRGSGNGYTTVITCTDGIILENITGFNIQALTFMIYLIQQEEKPVIACVSCHDVMITDTLFQGGRQDSFGRVINSADSDFTIINCTFEGNTDSYGGAIFAPVLNLMGNLFNRNTATGDGGAIHGTMSNISLYGNNFTRNRANSGST